MCHFTAVGDELGTEAVHMLQQRLVRLRCNCWWYETGENLFAVYGPTPIKGDGLWTGLSNYCVDTRFLDV